MCVSVSRSETTTLPLDTPQASPLLYNGCMDKPSSAKMFYVGITLALVAWGAMLAVGAFLGPEFWAPKSVPSVSANNEGETPVKPLARPFDVRKPLIVVACMGLFLGGWALALRSRHKRLQRAEAERVEQAAAEAKAAAQAQALTERSAPLK